MWASEWPEFHKTKNKKITEKQQETQNEMENKTKIKTESKKRFAGKDVKNHSKLKIYLISTSWAKWARHHQQQQQQQHRQQQQ